MKFCVEFKFRSRPFKSKLQWSSPKLLGRYGVFAKDNNIPFYDVVELGGKARKHKRVL